MCLVKWGAVSFQFLNECRKMCSTLADQGLVWLKLFINFLLFLCGLKHVLCVYLLNLRLISFGSGSALKHSSASACVEDPAAVRRLYVWPWAEAPVPQPPAFPGTWAAELPGLQQRGEPGWGVLRPRVRGWEGTLAGDAPRVLCRLSAWPASAAHSLQSRPAANPRQALHPPWSQPAQQQPPNKEQPGCRGIQRRQPSPGAPRGPGSIPQLGPAAQPAPIVLHHRHGPAGHRLLPAVGAWGPWPVSWEGKTAGNRREPRDRVRTFGQD